MLILIFTLYLIAAVLLGGWTIQAAIYCGEVLRGYARYKAHKRANPHYKLGE